MKMDKRVMGVSIEFDSRGEMLVNVAYFKVYKETAKMLVINCAEGDGGTVGYKDHIRKAELGKTIKGNSFSTGFEFSRMEIAKDKEFELDVISKVLERAREELTRRDTLAYQWLTKFRKCTGE
jgi:hypothetical protein